MQNSQACLITGVRSLLIVITMNTVAAADALIDYNRDIRPILFSKCIKCHGPDEAERKGGPEGLRLDTAAGATLDLGGYSAISPGHPDRSSLLARVSSADPDEVMPPPSAGKPLTPTEIDLLRRWIQEGASYSQHWSYTKPTTPSLPTVQNEAWARNPIDRFVLQKLEGLQKTPNPEADRNTLARRVSLDLTGLPPTLEEVQAYRDDPHPDAYERYVDRLLQKPTFGEHWAHYWLDLARYADSAGYADDPERTIWLYRDYVIRSFNENKPFDQFTIEQIAGDLLPNSTPDQLIATAFHRNTMTNNEGGTNDEEFRNVAVVDRVNTTFSVWMATTMACAQCHTHKFDPITQAEYFEIFAIFNNTKDADKRDESPLFSYFTPEQIKQRQSLENDLAQAERELQQETPALKTAQLEWERDLPREVNWMSLEPLQVSAASGRNLTIEDDAIRADAGAPSDVYTLDFQLPKGNFSAVQLEVLPDPQLPGNGPGHADGNFVISQISGQRTPNHPAPIVGRYVRIQLPGRGRMLSLAEVQVMQGEKNLALSGTATQSSTAYDGPAQLAIDGVTDGDYFTSNSVTHTNPENNPWWEVDLKSQQVIDHVTLWNRTDGGTGSRLADFEIEILGERRESIWKRRVASAPSPSLSLKPDSTIPAEFTQAFASYSQAGFNADVVLKNKNPRKNGWAVGGEIGKSNFLTLHPAKVLSVEEPQTLSLTIGQQFESPNHTLGRFRVRVTEDPLALTWGKLPRDVHDVLSIERSQRTPAQQKLVDNEFRRESKLLEPQRKKVASVQAQLDAIRPVTVPVCEELPVDQQRITRIQIRGNYQNLGESSLPGTPAIFHPLSSTGPVNRLSLAHWLVDPENPLTARVTANRYWEQIFGIGLVATSEDFGTQGDLPSHPELLDWLATELVRLNWDTKAFLKLLVTSATYRQSSQVTAEQYEEDPENRLLARGPRFRLTAEMIRDQAMAISGLLSPKMYGPPVKPLQPVSGLSAAFGGKIDWKTSEGEDRYRRALYTSWRRSNPYPSMATFDAPNREVCTVRRGRTNTPLQALVTLNDPVYVEAAQALARRVLREGGTSTESRARYLFQLTLSRSPSQAEVNRLVQLHDQAHSRFASAPEQAQKMATEPLGPLPDKMDPVDAASWTVVSNIVLNLDELFMKR